MSDPNELPLIDARRDSIEDIQAAVDLLLHTPLGHAVVAWGNAKDRKSDDDGSSPNHYEGD